MGDTTFNNYYLLGMCEMYRKHYAASRAYLLEAARINQFQNAGCVYRLGMACIDADSLDKGLGYMKRAVALLTPDKSVMFTICRYKGEAYYKKGDYLQAASSWEAAHKANPTAPQPSTASPKPTACPATRTVNAPPSPPSSDMDGKPTDDFQKMIDEAKKVVGE